MGEGDGTGSASACGAIRAEARRRVPRGKGQRVLRRGFGFKEPRVRRAAAGHDTERRSRATGRTASSTSKKRTRPRTGDGNVRRNNPRPPPPKAGRGPPRGAGGRTAAGGAPPAHGGRASGNGHPSDLDGTFRSEITPMTDETMRCRRSRARRETPDATPGRAKKRRRLLPRPASAGKVWRVLRRQGGPSRSTKRRSNRPPLPLRGRAKMRPRRRPQPCRSPSGRGLAVGPPEGGPGSSPCCRNAPSAPAPVNTSAARPGRRLRVGRAVWVAMTTACSASAADRARAISDSCSGWAAGIP